MNEALRMKILVVGGGPVGCISAALFKKEGHHVRCIDKNDHLGSESKAVGVHETTRNGPLAILGVKEEFDKRGVFIRRLHFYDQQTSMADIAPPFEVLSIPQGITEEILNRFIHVERNTECIYADEKGRAKIRLPDGKIEEDTFDLIIGADGAHSFIRHSLNISFRGHRYPEMWNLRDVEFEQSPLPEGEALLRFFPGGILFLAMPIGPKRYRLFTNVPHCLSYIPEEWKVATSYWEADYHVSTRHVCCYYKGKCALIGDAAHLSTPVGATGMNSGMEDAYELYLAIKNSQKGETLPKVLKTWSKKRHKFQKELLNITDGLYRFVTCRCRIVKWLRNLFFTHLLSKPWFQKKLFSHFTNKS